MKVLHHAYKALTFPLSLTSIQRTTKAIMENELHISQGIFAVRTAPQVLRQPYKVILTSQK